ncbi:MAG TPA: 3-hydroxyacyl-ACP dehydratase FabZ family protein [Bauldia sp.]|nr:3-hydroxyacyl-ACP dehydratase FabZ family protein [Bauldia sp.]
MRLEYFELLDRVEEIDLDGGTIRIACTLPERSTIFEGHFPGFPILPGVLMLEIMNQSAGYMLYRRFKRERFVFLGGVKRAKFRRMVKPGEKLDVRAKITHDGSGFFIAETSLRAGGDSAADAEIILIVQDFPSPEAKAALARSTDFLEAAPAVTA